MKLQNSQPAIICIHENINVKYLTIHLLANSTEYSIHNLIDPWIKMLFLCYQKP